MDLVFVNKSPVHTSLITSEGNVYYHISTEIPSADAVPITHIEATKETLPLQRVSREEFKRIPKAKEDVARIDWKGDASTPAYLHCKALDKEVVPAERFMKKRHALKLPSKRVFGRQKEQSFVGDDGVKYRWKMMPYGCILTRADNHVEVARCDRRRVVGDVFSQHKKRTTLHIDKPQTLTLDLSLLLTTFLWMDHPRTEKNLAAVEWSPLSMQERPRCSSDTERSTAS